MTSDHGFRQPVSGSSIMCPHPQVHYTELSGFGVLCRADTKVLSSLSPSAAAAWARFDGRTPLAAIESDSSLIELARRLRAVGALIDAVPSSSATGGDDGAAEGSVSWPGVRIHGAPAPSADGSGVTIALSEGTVDEDGGPTVSIDVGPDEITVGSAPVVALIAPGGGIGDPPGAAMDALEVIVACVDTDELAQPGRLDALAELVERVPLVGCPPAAFGDHARPAPAPAHLAS